MTTAGAQDALRALWTRARLATRRLTAIALATLAGGVVWLTTLTVLKEAGFEPVDFARELALGLGAEGSRQAVGIAGLGATLAGFLGVALLQALVVEPLIARRKEPAGGSPPHLLRFGPAALLTLVLAGFVAAPIMGIGVMGLDESGSTTVAILVGTVTSAVSLVRVYTLVASTRWWEEKDQGVQHAFAERPAGGLLEFPEQGGEKGGEGPGREADPSGR